jgi:glycosyltransferase involved in cell wall biosynthesis
LSLAKLKVVHVITKLDVGGAQETALNILTGLDRETFAPCLVCGLETGSTGSLHHEARRRGVEVHVVPSLVRRLSPLRDLAAGYQLWRFMKRVGPDVVHTHSSKAGVLGRAAAHLAGTAVVVHSVHGWSFRPYQPAWVQRLAVLAERLMATTCDLLVVVAEADRREGLKRGVGTPEQYRVIRNGVAINRIAAAGASAATVRRQLGVPAGSPLVGSVMRLAPPKDPGTFLRAVALVASNRPDTRFAVIGDGPGRHDAEALAVELGVSDQVIFAGVRRDVAEVLGALDLFVLSSTSEGLPRVVVEAMAAGVPVVASDVGGVSEVVDDGVTGRLVPPADPDALAAAMLDVLDHPRTSGQLARSARAAIAGHDLGVAERCWRDVYLAGSAGGGRRERDRSPLAPAAP